MLQRTIYSRRQKGLQYRIVSYHQTVIAVSFISNFLQQYHSVPFHSVSFRSVTLHSFRFISYRLVYNSFVHSVLVPSQREGETR